MRTWEWRLFRLPGEHPGQGSFLDEYRLTLEATVYRLDWAHSDRLPPP